jgi:putative methyltransferase (TIGR04325 family)
LKELVRQICPPVLWQAVARARQSLAPASTRMFGGVFKSFDQITDQQPWRQPGYLEMSRGQLHEAPAVHATAQTAHAVLSVLLNTMPLDRTPRVLDWGGGTGLRYWTTRPSLNRGVDWLVVDNPVLAGLSHEIKGTSPELSFAAALPEPSPRAFDIVLVFSSLQYVEDQEQLLEAFAAYRPRFIVLPRLMGHQDATYVTRQVMLGRATPCKVSSVAALTHTLAAHGYERILMMRDGFDLSLMCDDDVPVHLRPGREWLLVFREAS